jgi:hypothetical protein
MNIRGICTHPSSRCTSSSDVGHSVHISVCVYLMSGSENKLKPNHSLSSANLSQFYANMPIRLQVVIFFSRYPPSALRVLLYVLGVAPNAFDIVFELSNAEATSPTLGSSTSRRKPCIYSTYRYTFLRELSKIPTPVSVSVHPLRGPDTHINIPSPHLLRNRRDHRYRYTQKQLMSE